MHSYHTTKWREPITANPHESADYEWGNVYRAEHQSFNALETMVDMLEYRQVCTRSILWKLKQGQKEQCMQVCKDLLNQHKAEHDSVLDYIITSDKMCCLHYELESKWQSMEWWIPHQRKSSERSSQQVKWCALSFGSEGGDPSGTWTNQQLWYLATLTKLKAQNSRVRTEKKTVFLLQHDDTRLHACLKIMMHVTSPG